MATPSDTRPTRSASFQVTPLSGSKELIDLVAADLAAIEAGFSLLERDLQLGERGCIDLLARDASGRLAIVVCSLESDPPIGPALDKCAWLSEHSPIVARLFVGRALDLSATPRIVGLAPSFAPSTKVLASQITNPSLTLVEWRHVQSADVHGLVLERIGANAARPRATPAVAPSVATPQVQPPAPAPATPPRVVEAPIVRANPPSPPPAGGSAASATSIVATAPEPSDGMRLYARAKERILKIDPRIEPIEADDRGDFLFLHKTLVELRRTSDALWLRVPPSDNALPIRSERELDRELHAVIEKFFRLYLSGRTDVSRPDTKAPLQTSERDPLQPAKLTEEELREFYRLENGSNG
ncbi:MAG: hypothetical protein HY292_22485 [Planctomycetes bacterium]|nr:hypothetical protein [Planctomycetota bacterium]